MKADADGPGKEGGTGLASLTEEKPRVKSDEGPAEPEIVVEEVVSRGKVADPHARSKQAAASMSIESLGQQSSNSMVTINKRAAIPNAAEGQTRILNEGLKEEIMEEIKDLQKQIDELKNQETGAAHSKIVPLTVHNTGASIVNMLDQASDGEPRHGTPDKVDKSKDASKFGVHLKDQEAVKPFDLSTNEQFLDLAEQLEELKVAFCKQLRRIQLAENGITHIKTTDLKPILEWKVNAAKDTAKLKKQMKLLVDEREKAEAELVNSIMESSVDSGEDVYRPRFNDPPTSMKDVFPSLKKLKHNSPQGPKLKVNIGSNPQSFRGQANLSPFHGQLPNQYEKL